MRSLAGRVSLRRRSTGRAGKWHEGSRRDKQIKEEVEKRSERKCDRTQEGQPSDGREVGEDTKQERRDRES